MKKMFKLGCAGLGIQASSIENPVSLIELPILEQFKLVKEAEVWDFIDRVPNNYQELDEYIKGSQIYDLPVLSGSGCYTLGLDEDLIKQNINLTAEVGGKYHNFMVWAKHKDGHYVTNEEVAESYLDAFEYAEKPVSSSPSRTMWTCGLKTIVELRRLLIWLRREESSSTWPWTTATAFSKLKMQLSMQFLRCVVTMRQLPNLIRSMTIVTQMNGSIAI